MAEDFHVPSLFKKGIPQPGAYIPPRQPETHPFAPDAYGRHLIQGYNLGLYVTPQEVLDNVAYTRKSKEGANELLPPDFEDSILRAMGFSRERAHPSLPYTIQRIPEEAKPPTG